jgi:hypothetical protein
MKHIRQINSVDTDSYTIVNTISWTLPLEDHPSIIEHPELFEITEDPIPEQYQYLIYQS